MSIYLCLFFCQSCHFLWARIGCVCKVLYFCVMASVSWGLSGGLLYQSRTGRAAPPQSWLVIVVLKASDFHLPFSSVPSTEKHCNIILSPQISWRTSQVMDWAFFFFNRNEALSFVHRIQFRCQIGFSLKHSSDVKESYYVVFIWVISIWAVTMKLSVMKWYLNSFPFGGSLVF